MHQFNPGRPPVGSLIVVIPVCNEAEYIGGCVEALALQAKRPDHVVLFFNNCTDDGAALARGMQPALPFRLSLTEASLPPPLANAGNARRLAMDHAVSLAMPGDALLTTDADGRASPQWVAANWAALTSGADVVCGQADIDPADGAALPAHLRDDDDKEQAYARLLDEIASVIDPDPADPWPRHSEHSGASIAVTLAAFRRAGGVPKVATSEDRALVEALARVDARIRHEPTARVTVSGRLVGRASGGMAETISRRLIRQDEYTDDRLEPPDSWQRRITLRAEARRAWQHGSEANLAARLSVPGDFLDETLRMVHFGAAWAKLEAASPVLAVREAVPFTALPSFIARARRILRAAKTGLDRPHSPAAAFA